MRLLVIARSGEAAADLVGGAAPQSVVKPVFAL
jgi:hypothetical protein